MLTYELKKSPGVPLYEALYRCIRADILSGVLKPGQKLPSKRALAQNLEVSKITVEGAYNQLLAEGYIRGVEKVGYFVEEIPQMETVSPIPAALAPAESAPLLDLTGAGSEKFPFSVWSRLQREVMLDYGEKLLLPLPAQGIPELREAIAGHLLAFRGMTVDPGNILVGAGTDFLYNLLIQLLGRDKVYAVEDPGYLRLSKIYEKNDVTVHHIPMDGSGIIPERLEESGAEILHITPSHHFPTGIVMPVSRRYEFLSWASKGENRYIIEDDYDCEFRLSGRPIPTLQSIDVMEKVIYINTFSKSLAPAFRISYLVLPKHLVTRFYETLGFYSGTVSCLEQMTLARFLSEGYFEKHINRMRNHYRAMRDRLLAEIHQSPLADKVQISEENAGLHFLIKVDTPRSDEEILQAAEREGIRLSFVSQYYMKEESRHPHVLVMNYSGLEGEKIPEAVARLCRAVLE